MSMNKIWNKMFGMRFSVDEDALQDFVKWNTNQWNSIKHEQEGYCYLNFNMINKEMSMMIPKLLYAKGIEKRLGIKPVIIDWGMSEELIQLYESFGVAHINLHKHMYCNVAGIVKSLFVTLSCRMRKISGEQLQELTWKGVNIGKSIYSDALRSSDMSTIKYVDNMTCVKKIFKMVLFADTLFRLVDQYSPKVCISDDWAYNEGIVLEVMNAKKAFIAQTNILRENILTNGKGTFIQHRNSEMHEQIARFLADDKFQIDESVVDAYLESRFSGKNSSFRDKVAFLGKKTMTRAEWNESMGLDPNKKNVIIMCHTFSDAVFNSCYTAFRDYYDWTEKTLQLISDMDQVNWIIKPHPARGSYNEAKDSIENMIAKYESKNIHVFPDDVSTSSLKDVADALVTICGTAGTEFPCFGIPVIACGQAFYAGFGYTKTPNTLEEYKSMLQNIQHMDRLTDEQVQTARNVLYAFIACFDTPLDEFDQMLIRTLREYQNKPDEAGVDKWKEYNSKMIHEIMDYISKNKWENTQFYQRGFQLYEKMKERQCV